MFNDRLEIHNSIMVKIQHTWHTHYHRRPQRGGGAKVGVHPPPHRKSNNFFYYMAGLSVIFSMWGPFWYVFPLTGGPFHNVRAFLLPCLHVRAFLLRFSTYGGPFHHVRAFLLPFSPCGGPYLLSWWGLLLAGAHAHYIYYNTFMLKCINI